MSWLSTKIRKHWLPVLSYGALALAMPVAWSSLQAADCLGPAQASKGYLVYLHGLEPLAARTGEGAENRRLLERLAKEFSLRIALPRGMICAQQKVCWPAKDSREVMRTFGMIQTAMKGCWSGNQPYTILGFSNGGFFGFKLYKIHKDTRLKHIIAAGASGLWDPKVDKRNPLSQLQMMIGDKDITLSDASKFAERFRDVDPGFTLYLFNGGHRLDYDTLARLMRAQRSF